MNDRYPERIVCLTEETTETLYLLGEGHRVAGISGYTLRPPEARSKPKVSSFISARFEKIEALQPDLILTFSDLQAGISSELVKRGLPVFAFNQRSVADILVEIAGGATTFPELRDKRLAKDRIVAEDEVLRRRPDVIMASWCGKKMKKSTITSRTGWTDLPAVQRDRIYEIPSTYILQPGPAALTDGVRMIYERLASMYAD